MDNKTPKSPLRLIEPKPGPTRLMQESRRGAASPKRGSAMTSIRKSLIAAVTLVVCGLALSPAQGAETRCTGTPAQYTAAIRQFQASMVQAQAQADVNPIYISDVEYYASVLAQAEHCIRSLAPVATVSR